MKKEIGLRLDRREQVIVILSDGGEEIKYGYVCPLFPERKERTV